ncbi:piwi-like 3 [Homarus americanus]|uniref:Piwi-like 3 n=1 Tax=Homarus americanus TaxID=6706 RepID=A0A8J5KDM8_HOMAM|nr:piwi-like 3 [Homarus americanus]
MSNTNECVVWTRPPHVMEKKGKTGQPIILRANYYEIKSTPDWALCMYHVTFTPDEDRTHMKKLLLRQHVSTLGNYIFDGNQLYVAHKLSHDPLELASKRPDDQTPYTVKIRFIKEVPPSDTQFLQVGRHYYNSKEEVQNHKYRVAIWPGHVSSIRQHEHSILMVTDAIHKFLRLDTVYEILRGIRNTKPDSFKYLAGKQLLGMIIMTRYNQRTYRIDDIAWNLTAVSKFSCQGQDITYMDYYQRTYQVAIKDPHQPLLMSKPKKRDLRRGQGNIYLIPELCVATGLSDEMRTDYNLMRDFAAWTRMAPDKRVTTLSKFNTRLFENAQVKAELQQWGLEFSQTLCQVRGRVLPSEVVTQGSHTFTYKNSDADWAREIKDVPMNVGLTLTNWLLVFPARLKQEADDFLSGVRRVSRSLGMVVVQPKIECLPHDSAQDYVRTVARYGGVQIIVCILPNNRLDRYAAIKKHASVVMAIPTQMVLARSLQNKPRLMSIIAKIAIQMNCKLGGEVWNVQIPFQNTMVVGYDAYHDSGRRGASWGAVVASFNKNLTRYYGQACFEANNYSPRFSFLVVSKRINTRLFAQGVNTGTPINPPPGTVCDDGPVRVPAPCLYAHKLAYITGQAIHDVPHRNLSDKLWYL